MDVMVTARMSQAKKEAGNAVLAKLDINASQAINRFYDYMIRYRRLPFDSSESAEWDNLEIQKAVAWVDDIVSDGIGAFAGRTADEIRQERLGALSNAPLKAEEGS